MDKGMPDVEYSPRHTLLQLHLLIKYQCNSHENLRYGS
jgi:hypothetical protein